MGERCKLPSRRRILNKMKHVSTIYLYDYSFTKIDYNMKI